MTMTGWVIFLAVFMAAYLIYDHFKTKKINANNPLPVTETRELPRISEEELLSENRVRSQWLLSFIIYSLWGVVAWILQIVFDPSGVDQLGGKEYGEEFATGLTFVTVLIYLFFIGITYYLAYRKRGTAWLTFLLIMYFLFGVATIFAYLSALLNPELAQDLFSPFKLSLTSVSLLLMVYYWVSCYRLRKSNIIGRKRSV